MRNRLSAPRSTDYWIFRCCERLKFCVEEFLEIPYETQMQLLAYELLRQAEEAASVDSGMQRGR